MGAARMPGHGSTIVHRRDLKPSVEPSDEALMRSALASAKAWQRDKARRQQNPPTRRKRPTR